MEISPTLKFQKMGPQVCIIFSTILLTAIASGASAATINKPQIVNFNDPHSNSSHYVNVAVNGSTVETRQSDGGGEEDESGEVKFKLGARGLPSIDDLGTDPNPFAVLSGALNDRTETLTKTSNPDWPDEFAVIYMPDTQQDITVTVNRLDANNNTFRIGTATFSVADVADSCNDTHVQISGGQSGTLVVRNVTDCESKGTAWWVWLLVAIGAVIGIALAIWLLWMCTRSEDFAVGACSCMTECLTCVNNASEEE